MNQYTPMIEYGLTNLGMGFFLHSIFMLFHCLCFRFCQNRRRKIFQKKIISVIKKKIIELPKLLQNAARDTDPLFSYTSWQQAASRCLIKSQCCPSEAEKIFSLENLHISSIQVHCCALFIALQVLYLHIVLGLQDLLCVWLHAAGVHHPDHRHRLRDHCLHLFPAKCRGLQMVRAVCELVQQFTVSVEVVE